LKFEVLFVAFDIAGKAAAKIGKSAVEGKAEYDHDPNSPATN
jgi:hypothetical protein